ncbi:MAG: CoA ester lyase [Actinomycetota bacterium]|nr:CoA ester lyase [Actinomycetota bacterium]
MSDFRENVNSPVPSLASARSVLFAPGNDRHKLAKALESGADAVVADLEDAVPPEEKSAARTVVRELLPAASTSSLVAVRVNAADTSFWEDDLRAVADLELAALVLPKATPDAVERLGREGPPVLAIVESAQGLRRAYDVASAPRVAALALGAVDLGVELRLEPRADGQEVLVARSLLVLDSAAAGLRAPFDLVHLALDDVEGLEAECRLARSLGFRGKVCVHPAQVEVVNRVFSPTRDELERARRVVEAYDRGVADGAGVVRVDGEMVDLPVVERARQVLAEAERSASSGS